jgi:hypothetical protein
MNWSQTLWRQPQRKISRRDEKMSDPDEDNLDREFALRCKFDPKKTPEENKQARCEELQDFIAQDFLTALPCHCDNCLWEAIKNVAKESVQRNLKIAEESGITAEEMQKRLDEAFPHIRDWLYTQYRFMVRAALKEHNVTKH